MKKEEILHAKVQASLDRMQANYDELSLVLQKLCQRLGDLIGYEHKKKSSYRILVNANNREYDVDDLIEQAEEYLGASR